MEQPQPLPQIPSSCSRSCGHGTNSPEFEFWMVGNPSFPPPNLLSADELFSDGFLLPLRLLQPPPPPPQDAPEKTPEPEPPTPEPPELPPNSNSRKWRHIFKKKTSPSIVTTDDQSPKEKREKKNGGVPGFGAGNVVNAAELNIINIWPFSRSRSAGNGGTRPRPAAAARKVSSAPCSRSNSTGESKSKKWPPHSPSRAAGVHLGRTSPVWQVRRGSGRSSEAAARNGGRRDGNEERRKFPASKATALSLKVPMCIGYRSNLSCRENESAAVGVAGGGSQVDGDVSGEVEVVRRSNLFNIRSLFPKKIH